MKAISRDTTDNAADVTWHLALCRPNQGHIAFRNLVKANVDVFMPRHRASWRWRGKQVDGWRPLFGGYLFFAMDPLAPRWREVMTMPGIRSVVNIGPHGPARVPSAVVTELIARCDADGCLIPDTAYAAGDAVRLTSGPFAGFVGEVLKVDPDRRIHMLMQVMGRETALTASHEIVQRQR